MLENFSNHTEWKPAKLKFLKKKVCYLGYVVSAEAVVANPEMIATICE